MNDRKATPVLYHQSISSLFIFFLIGLFAVLAVTLTLVSVRAYRSVNQASVSNSVGQIALSYLHNKIHSLDEVGHVELKTMDGIEVLCLREAIEEDVYETRIFFLDGALQEYFCDNADPFDPENGETIADLKALTMEITHPWLLSIEAVQPDGKAQRLHIALRTGEDAL